MVLSNPSGLIDFSNQTKPKQPIKQIIYPKIHPTIIKPITKQIQNQKSQNLTNITKQPSKFSFKFHNSSLSKTRPLNSKTLSTPSKLLSFARSLYQKELSAFNAKQLRTKREDSLVHMSKAGVSRDKLYALTLAVQEDPLHRFDLVTELVGIAKEKKPKDAIVAIELLSDLFASYLLPDRKLNYLVDPNGCANGCDFVARYYEHLLKGTYNDFLTFAGRRIREKTYDWFKFKVIKFLFDLLEAKPEGEEIILASLVKQLSAERNIVSRVLFHFEKLLKLHPGMKENVAEEVWTLLKSKDLQLKPRFYALNLLSQFLYTSHEADKSAAIKCVAIFVDVMSALSKQITHKASDSISKDIFKTLSVVFRGLRRSMPYAGEFDMDGFSEQMDILFKTSHIPHFNTVVDSLSLLFTIFEKQNKIPERFFTALYSALLYGDIKNSKRQTDFFSLVYQAIERDTEPNRILAFIKRLLQSTTTYPVALICASLLVVNELANSKRCVAEYFAKLKPFTANSNKNGPLCRTKCDFGTVKRNPLFSEAEKTLPVEILFLQTYPHAVISKLADDIYMGRPASYHGDPTIQLTTNTFLNKLSSEDFGAAIKTEKTHKKVETKTPKKKRKRRSAIQVEAAESISDILGIAKNKWHSFSERLRGHRTQGLITVTDWQSEEDADKKKKRKRFAKVSNQKKSESSEFELESGCENSEFDLDLMESHSSE